MLHVETQTIIILHYSQIGDPSCCNTVPLVLTVFKFRTIQFSFKTSQKVSDAQGMYFLLSGSKIHFFCIGIFSLCSESCELCKYKQINVIKFDGIRTVFMYFTIWVVIPLCPCFPYWLSSHVGASDFAVTPVAHFVLFYVGNSKFSIDLCKKNSMMLCVISVFTVNNLPDFIYLILACCQDWIKMHHIYELLRKITAEYILQASIVQNTGHIPPSFVNMFLPPHFTVLYFTLLYFTLRYFTLLYFTLLYFTFKLVGMLATFKS